MQKLENERSQQVQNLNMRQLRKSYYVPLPIVPPRSHSGPLNRHNTEDYMQYLGFMNQKTATHLGLNVNLELNIDQGKSFQVQLQFAT